MSANDWLARPDVGEHLRPRSFNGRLANRTLVPIADPVDAIQSSNVKLNISGKRTSANALSDKSEEVITRTVGFEFFCQA